MLNAMVWIAKSGAPWRDMTEYYGPWKSVYSRLRKWLDIGILKEIFKKLSQEAELGEISIDTSIAQAYQHSAGARKMGRQMKSGTAVAETAPKSMRQLTLMAILSALS